MLVSKNLPKWLISDDIIIRAYLNQTIETKKFSVSKAIFALGILVSIIPLFLICNIKILIYKARFRSKTPHFGSAELLIGNDYKTDEFYALNILKENKTSFDQMNQFMINNYLNKKINIFYYQNIIFSSCVDLFKISRIKENKIRVDALLCSIKNICFYVIYRAFFRYYKSVGLQRVNLIAMPLMLMAAMEEEHIPCSVYLHGLSVRIPQQSFPLIDALFLIAEDEKNYFSTLMPEHRIKLYEFNPLHEYKNKAVLLLRETLNITEVNLEFMNVDDIHALSSFLKKIKIDLYFKIHPKTDEDKLEDFIKILEIDESKLIKSRAPISDNIIIIQPKFIFGWFSSGLAESLSLNIIPVMINPITIAKKIQTGSTFDYKNRCLDFKTDQELIESCSTNNDEYKKTLNRLKNNA
ncbi:hypothetical protein N8317_04070 [Gammaproteobacteria bacterium]|nr:hypothetical protein [Gammaproteobacteria bacterium]